jgi:septum formation protein
MRFFILHLEEMRTPNLLSLRGEAEAIQKFKTMKLILSSTSISRKQLLQRLQIPFKTVAPNIDETPYDNESPKQLVKRLAEAKAKIHASKYPDALIIGCDQVAVLDDEIVSKPETHEEAVKQLKKSSSKKIIFYTGLCLLNTKTHSQQTDVEKFTVYYRHLTQQMIENYLQREKPYHCAGSIKAEGLGIALLEKVSGKDPTSLTGLPLISLVKMLEKENVKVL